ncbi:MULTISPECIES: NAD(P)H-dependent oxidoreductase [Streptomyces]|uniref:NAD(P)H-dependent oxidoreductase n=1 Tax=Streptomyces TaxID=1883 RepID=UPI00345BD46E
MQVSDLYAMKWKAALDADDFPGHPGDRPLAVMSDSERATPAGRLTPDVAAEQEKLRWSDAVILQFPLWWFSAPAILKGWIDRVFTADVLHPIQHGLFWFTGMAPVEPFVRYHANELPPERVEAARRAYARRLDGLITDAPVPFRTLTGGDYDHDMRLLPGRETPGTSGLDLHAHPRP